MKFIFLSLLFFTLTCKDIKLQAPPSVINGVIDLQQWDFQGQEPVDLYGDWELYWNQFLEPTERVETFAKNRTGYIKPGIRWEGASINGTMLNGTGFATYRLKLLFSENNFGQIFCIKFRTTGGLAYKIYIDKQLQIELGRVGTNKETMLPTRKTADVYLTVQSTEIFLTVQMSNFYHADGTFWYTPVIGKIPEINFTSKRKQAVDTSLLGSIFIMALYHLSIFIYRKKDKTALFFGLFCLFVSIYMISVNEVFIYYFFPELPFAVAHRLLVVYYLFIPMYLSFLYTLFPLEFPKGILKVIWIVFSFMYLFIFVTDLSFGSRIERPSIIFVLSAFIFAFYVVTRAVIHKRNFSIFIFIPNLALVIAVINDVFSIYSYTQKPIIMSYAIFIFIIVQSILLSWRFSKATVDVEKLSEELCEINTGLEEIVKQRTIQYKEEKEKAENANLWKDKFISLVSHDLRSPLHSIYSILSIIESDISLSEEERIKLIQHVKSTVFNSASTVKHLLSLSRFQNNSMPIVQINIELYSTFIELCDNLSNELRRKNIKVINLIPIDTIFTVDKIITEEIFRNILMNAVKFTMENGEITIDYCENANWQIITIRDTGIGIQSHIKESLFKKEISTQGTMGEKGFGIGLKLCNELMQLQNGFIKIESIEGLGSQFSIYFPNNENTILLVGDTKDAPLLKKELENNNYLVVQLKNKAEALERLDKINCKLILLSESLSAFDINEFIQNIHTNFLYADKPVVVLSSNYDIKTKNVFKINPIIGIREIVNKVITI